MARLNIRIDESDLEKLRHVRTACAMEHGIWSDSAMIRHLIRQAFDLLEATSAKGRQSRARKSKRSR